MHARSFGAVRELDLNEHGLARSDLLGGLLAYQGRTVALRLLGDVDECSVDQDLSAYRESSPGDDQVFTLSSDIGDQRGGLELAARCTSGIHITVNIEVVV